MPPRPRDYDFRLWARAALTRWASESAPSPLPRVRVPCEGCVYCGRPLTAQRERMGYRVCSEHADLPALDTAAAS